MSSIRFPFATVEDLRDRWPDLPSGADRHAEILLEDASQFILDVVPDSVNASESTRRRVACSVVRRAIQSADSPTAGFESVQQGAGGYQATYRPINPYGDFFLTANEKKALGHGQAKAWGAKIGHLGDSRSGRWWEQIGGEK